MPDARVTAFTILELLMGNQQGRGGRGEGEGGREGGRGGGREGEGEGEGGGRGEGGEVKLQTKV